MENLYRQFFNTFLAPMDAEKAHHMGLMALVAANKIPGALSALRRFIPEPDPRLVLSLWDLSFSNPLGVAAGLDKDAEAVNALLALGFGHIEVGTITLHPQMGNPKPRLWRIQQHNAVINSMGFPSDGVEKVKARLLGYNYDGIIGLNIGKNRQTDLENAADDYSSLIQNLGDVGDYITVNVSSPNTPGLRSLQQTTELTRLLTTISKTNIDTANQLGKKPKPLLVKLSPDLSDSELIEISGAAVQAGAAGLIATNTTINRDGLSAKDQDLPGGLSGRPLKKRATKIVRLLYREVGKYIPIIGVGGIENATDVIERIKAGASLVQIYTAFVYGGPSLAGQILRDLSKDADLNGWKSIKELVGIEA